VLYAVHGQLQRLCREQPVPLGLLVALLALALLALVRLPAVVAEAPGQHLLLSMLRLRRLLRRERRRVIKLISLSGCGTCHRLTAPATTRSWWRCWSAIS
jgi:hypothetical protein